MPVASREMRGQNPDNSRLERRVQPGPLNKLQQREDNKISFQRPRAILFTSTRTKRDRLVRLIEY